MMMIAFMTVNNGLVPLIEGLCAQILYFIFEIIDGLRSHLLLLFFRRKHVLKKKAVSPRSHPAFQHIQSGKKQMVFYAIAARKEKSFT